MPELQTAPAPAKMSQLRNTAFRIGIKNLSSALIFDQFPKPTKKILKKIPVLVNLETVPSSEIMSGPSLRE